MWPKDSYGESVWLPLRVNTNTGLNFVFVRYLAEFDPANYDSTPDFRHLSKIVRVRTDFIIRNLS